MRWLILTEVAWFVISEAKSNVAADSRLGGQLNPFRQDASIHAILCSH
jgi:hypothetical protein